MRIGIDARLYGETGIGRYISNLIKELEMIDNENEYIIFVTSQGSKLYTPKNPRFKKWLLDIKWYSFDEQIMGLKEFWQAKLDLLHVPHLNVPVLYRRKFVVTIHDLTMNNNFGDNKKNSVPFDYKKMGYDLALKSALLNSQKVIVPSQSVGDEISYKYNIKPEKFVVTHESVDDNLLKNVPQDSGVLRTRLEEFRVNNNYFLYIGSAYEHKNLNLLIVAFNELLKNPQVSLQLVIAGGKSRFVERVAAFSHALNLDGKVLYPTKYVETQYMSDKDLAFLYKGAMAYVFPSLSEGFSITPLEAQAMGVPVVLSDIPVHREVFGDSVAYFNPKSNIDLTEKLLEIYKNKDFREVLISRGKQNVTKYSWRKMAEETLKIYKQYA
jgi:glycosyltransferase involved in cell wall biosynthesis